MALAFGLAVLAVLLVPPSADAAPGDISTVAGDGTAAYGGDGADATVAQLNSPHGVAVDANGNLFIADTLNYRIRKVEGVAAPVPQPTPTLWEYYYQQADDIYAYFISQGDPQSALAYWYYYRAYGDWALRNSQGNTALAQKELYRGLAYYYYTILDGNAALYNYYLYLGYSEYYYYLTLGDSATAVAYYSYYLTLANYYLELGL